MALMLANTSDLQAALPGLDDATAASAIFRASALVRGVAQQQFDFVANDTVTLVGGERDLVLPQRPVYVDDRHPLAVMEMATSQSSGLSSVEGVNFSRVGDRLSKRYASQWQPGMLYGQGYAGLWSQPWPIGVWGPYVQVTYSHGYLTPPDWLTAIVLSAAVTYATNPGGLYSETVGGVTVTWQRHTATAKAGLIDQIRSDLSAVGIRRGGAFSIGTS